MTRPVGLLLALAIILGTPGVGVLSADDACAVVVDQTTKGGTLVNNSTYNRACWKYAGGDFYFYFSWTDSQYYVNRAHHVFLFLGANEGTPERYVAQGTVGVMRRGVATSGGCVICSCQGQTATGQFYPRSESSSSQGAYAFSSVSYDEYAALWRSLGGTPRANVYARYGYVRIDLSGGGSASITNMSTGSCPGGVCPTLPLGQGYVSYKTISNVSVVGRPAEILGDGVDNNGDGRVDETALGSRSRSCEEVGSSCDLASGNFTDTIPLLSVVGGPMPLDFAVTYNSFAMDIGRMGRGWTHPYRPYLNGDNGVRLSLVDQQGAATRYWKEGETYYYPLDRPGARDSIIKLADGSYERRWPDGRRWRFHPVNKALSEIRDANGHAVTLTYDAATQWLLERVSDPSGRWLEFTYNANDWIVQVADSSGRTVSFEYAPDASGQLTSIIDAAGGAWHFAYDSSGRMLTKTDPRGSTWTYAYDSAGRLTQVTDPANGTRQFVYDLATSTTRVLEPDGTSKIQQWHNVFGVPLAVTDPSGRTTRYTYDTRGLRLTRTDGANQTWQYTYDAAGRLETETDPLNRTTRWTYDPVTDRVLTRTEPDGALTQFTYDARGNLTQVIDPTGRATQFGYDPLGRLTTIIDPAGQTTTLAYNAQHQVTSVTDPTGVSVSFSYDAVGRLATVTDANGGTTAYAYDALSRLLSVTDPLTHTTSATYDGRGNVTSRTDALARVTQFAYDARGLLTATTDPAGGVTTYGYNNRKWLASLTDAESRTTSWTYDGAGRVLTETSPLGDVTTYQYDARGLVQFVTTPKGETLEYQYDPVGRLTARLGPGGLSESYTYEVNGRLETATGGGVSYTLAYDAAGRVTSVTDSRGYIVSYGYDAAGRRQTLTYPGGQVLTYGYDEAGRLTRLLDGARTITLGYDAVGRRASLTHATGARTTYAYDLASRLTGLTHATSGGAALESFTYGYDAADARTSLTTLAQSVGYGYDPATRLTGVTATPASPIPPEAFTYDRVGNRLTGPAPTDAYTYNAGHQLLSAPGATYTYDLNGNRTTKTDAAGTTTYTWDAANRLVQAVVPGTGGPATLTFTYDALGRRVRRVVVEPGGATTRTIDYVYDGEDVLLAVETTDTGGTPTTVTTRYVHGPGIDEPLLVEDGGQPYAVHADALGSIIALSDGSQTLAEASTYTSYGQLTRSDGVAGNVYAYTGREWEPELGLYYYRARYYDPEAGRFLSRDPIGFAGGDANIYAYVSGDPVNLIDPSGLCFRGVPTRHTLDHGGCGGGGIGGGSFKGVRPYGNKPVPPAVGRSGPPANAGSFCPLPPSVAANQRFVSAPGGRLVPVPSSWASRAADNGRGIVFQKPGSTGNAHMIRIMEPTSRYPSGYVRYYNEHGQPLDINGRPGNPASTHIPLDYQGQIPGWPTE